MVMTTGHVNLQFKSFPLEASEAPITTMVVYYSCSARNDSVSECFLATMDYSDMRFAVEAWKESSIRQGRSRELRGVPQIVKTVST